MLMLEVERKKKARNMRAMYSRKRVRQLDAKTQGINQGTSARGSCKLTSPIGLQQSRAIGGQVSSLVVGCRRATRFGRRKAGGRFGVAAQICRVVGNAFFGIRCFVDGAAELRKEEGIVESTRYGLVGMVSCAVAGRMSARFDLVGAKL
jgi:hypothetical protein